MVDKTMPIESRETLIQLRGTNEFNFDNADTYLGDFDAASEWNNDIENARKSFLHISSYEQFLDESKLILLGRTGTGKTSILRCFEHDVKTRAGNLRYDYVINYDFSEMLSKIVDYENIISAPQVSIKLVESFEVMINTIVMHTLYNQYGQTHLEKVKKYLTEQGLIHIRGFSSIVRLFFQAAEDMKGTFGEYASSVASVYNFISKATSVSYYEALEELYAALQNKKFLILIDTLNEYNFEKAETITIIKALISLCFKYYNNRQNGIYTKIALPSEVYRRLITKVPGKQQGNTVTIQWTTKQLFCFIALRLYAWCQRQNAPMFAFWRTFAYDDF
ncbi:hypothetical protein LJC04_06620, partial [Ruminococcaceae bacterium OttesenSCG-928-O06]|nr:hypothetical protein [Ruminococcaceae bacterium OttesenSCG-928-O06]